MDREETRDDGTVLEVTAFHVNDGERACQACRNCGDCGGYIALMTNTTMAANPEFPY